MIDGTMLSSQSFWLPAGMPGAARVGRGRLFGASAWGVAGPWTRWMAHSCVARRAGRCVLTCGSLTLGGVWVLLAAWLVGEALLWLPYGKRS